MARVDIKLGYSCNDSCVHCVVDDFRDVLRARGMRVDQSTEQYRAELRDARARADSVVFTGGEPTIRRDLPELMAFARELGFAIVVQSNGRRLSDAAFADRVVAASPAAWCVALHGPCAEVHEAVTRTRGSYEQTVAGIRNLIERGQAVSGKIVLSRLNQGVVPETARRLLELGVRHVGIAFPHALGRARKLWDEVVPRYADVLPGVREAVEVLYREGGSADVETFTYCQLEGWEPCISENFQQLEDYVELRQYGEETGAIDWSVHRREIKTKFPQCARCRFTVVCEGPWLEYAERYGGEEFVPLPGRRVKSVREVLDGSFRAAPAWL